MYSRKNYKIAMAFPKIPWNQLFHTKIHYNLFQDVFTSTEVLQKIIIHTTCIVNTCSWACCKWISLFFVRVNPKVLLCLKNVREIKWYCKELHSKLISRNISEKEWLSIKWYIITYVDTELWSNNWHFSVKSKQTPMIM